MLFRQLAVATAIAVAGFAPAEGRTICTMVADAATGQTIVEQGDCATRVTPASTFKIALAVIGYDRGFLKDEHSPTLPFKEGYNDFGGEAWRQPTDPVRWLRYSVVWYSQQITHALGADALRDDSIRLGYGNADFSGDPGKNNGLERAWIGSSLKISPREQIAFLQKLVNRQLPVGLAAMEATMKVVEATRIEDGWTVHGKTGMAYPRLADDSFDEEHPWGWFVGWAEKDGRIVTFARLVQDERKMPGTAGNRTREQIFQELPALLKAR